MLVVSDCSYVSHPGASQEMHFALAASAVSCNLFAGTRNGMSGSRQSTRVCHELVA